MRPGYLGGLDGFWFGNLGGKYFETDDIFSAQPLFTIIDRVHGKTGEEFKAFERQEGWSSTNTPMQKTTDNYQNSPYWNDDLNIEWDSLLDDFRESQQIFKLTS